MIPELCINELEGLPTNNIIAERNFSTPDCLSKVGKSRERNFKGKALRNSMNFINRAILKLKKLRKILRLC